MKTYAILTEFYNGSLHTYCVEADSQLDAIRILKNFNFGFNRILMISQLEDDKVIKEFN